MMIEQQTKNNRLAKLKITGTPDELKALALDILDATDHGKTITTVGQTTIRIKCKPGEGRR
jgi:hypothetical protein